MNHYRRMLKADNESDDIFERDCDNDKECQDEDEWYVCRPNELSLSASK